jgi:hypothetical protein
VSDALDELRVGAKVAEGRFRIDQKRALAKLRSSRLADPSHWVLDVLRAAQASGAKQVEVRTDSDDVEVRFGGRPFPAAVMKDLLSQALGTDGDGEPRHRLFALGVAGAMGVGLKRLRVESGAVALAIDADSEVTLAEAKGDLTTLEARKALSLRVAGAWLTGESPEAQAIKRCAVRYGPALELNGEPVPQVPSPPKVLDEGGVRLWVRPVEDWARSQVDLDVLGVFVARRHLLLHGVQLEAVVQCDAMRRNASGTEVVDDDPHLEKALQALKRISLEELERLAKNPSDTLRARVAWRLMHARDLDEQTTRVLRRVPLFRGPAGELLPLEVLDEAVKSRGRLNVANAPYPKGSYPEPTVLLGAEARQWEPLLPGSKREDVWAVVRRNQRAAENKLQWEAQPREEPTLPPREWLASAELTLAKARLRGQVGIEEHGEGAFVRLLAQGRFLQAGEVSLLAPLRLRAVVDLTGPVSEKTWVEVPNSKLWSSVVAAVEDAAEQAIIKALSAPAPSAAALAHARDLLVRRAGDGRAGLPKAVLSAPLFECLGGGRASLEQLSGAQWRFVPPRPNAQPLLDGKRVLVLNETEQALLKPYAEGRLIDVSSQLEHELRIRRRLAGPKREPNVRHKLVWIPVASGAVHGEVAICEDATNRLQLALYRDGFLLDETSQTPRYGPTAAAVENPALTPSSDWSRAVHDQAFDEVIKLVRDAERELAVPLLDRFPLFRGMPLSARRWLRAFVKKELSGKSDLDDVARAVFEAKLFDGPEGPISFAELKARATATGHLWVLASWRPLELLKDQAAVISEGEEIDVLLKLGTGFEPEDGAAELARAAARAELLTRPVWEPPFGEQAPLRVAFSRPGLSCAAALDDALAPAAQVTVLVQQRLWCAITLPAGLPLQLIVQLDSLHDPSQPPDEALSAKLAEAVTAAEAQMLALALDTPGRPGARRAVLFALNARLDDALAEPLARRLRGATVFPCTDGVARSAEALDALDAVPFVTRRLEGTPRSGKPVVIAVPDVAVGLQRFEREDVTETLWLELEKRAHRATVAAVEQIRAPGPALVVQAVHGRMEGEVALVPAAEGRLELYFERRPLCVVPDALPLPLAAAVNCDTVTPSAGYDGVERDPAWRALLSALSEQVDPLATELAARWSELGANPAALECALRLCALLVNRKRVRAHPLLKLELLTTADGRRLSVDKLLEEMKTQKNVLAADRPGQLLAKNDRPVWLADFRQRDWLEPLKLEVKDVSDELERARRVRERPKVGVVRAPRESAWREPVAGPGVDGEIVLPEAPPHRLLIDVHHQRSLLECYEAEHPAGGFAAVNCDGLTPNPSWTKASRNARFRELLAQVAAAHGRLVARRVMQRDGGWRPWAEAAVRWNPPELRGVLPTLELFEALDGRPVTVGAVLAEYQRTRRVAVAAGELDGGDAFVLADSPTARELLGALDVTVKEVSDELIRKGEQQADRVARRLKQLSWPGEALVRMKVQARGMSGELALPADAAGGEVTLAKQGVRVKALASSAAPGVAGVVDIEALAVDEAWTEARLSTPEREAIDQAVSELLAQLAHAVPSLSKDRNAAARGHVLTWLQRSGLTAAAHVDRLTGVPAALAKAGVFETAGGEWVSLSVLADEVRRRGKVAVFRRSLFRPDTAGAVGLWARSVEEPWLDGLEALLGKGALERVSDAAAWRETLREEDPPPGSPELWGLSRLRRDVRLLRAGALGELSPEDVEDVRLKALGGQHPVHYDAKRKVVLLDGEHAQVKRALSEAKVRRERLYVLLAAIYGAINRALERITDQHEEQLSAALAAHLAANPQLLEPGEG